MNQYKNIYKGIYITCPLLTYFYPQIGAVILILWMLVFQINDTLIIECMTLQVMPASHENGPVMNYHPLKE